jgi:hypothetical protein
MTRCQAGCTENSAGRLSAGGQVDQVPRIGHRQHAEDAAEHVPVVAYPRQNQKNGTDQAHQGRRFADTAGNVADKKPLEGVAGITQDAGSRLTGGRQGQQGQGSGGRYRVHGLLAALLYQGPDPVARHVGRVGEKDKRPGRSMPD